MLRMVENGKEANDEWWRKEESPRESLNLDPEAVPLFSCVFGVWRRCFQGQGAVKGCRFSYTFMCFPWCLYPHVLSLIRVTRFDPSDIIYSL